MGKNESRASSGKTGWVCPGVAWTCFGLQVRRGGPTFIESLPWKQYIGDSSAFNSQNIVTEVYLFRCFKPNS